MNAGSIVLVSTIAAVGFAYIGCWWAIERARARNESVPPEELAAWTESRRVRWADPLVGFVTNFFDTLGFGSFAPTTAYFKLRARMPDEQIPGTLNVGQALPSMSQALIFISIASNMHWMPGGGDALGELSIGLERTGRRGQDGRPVRRRRGRVHRLSRLRLQARELGHLRRPSHYL